MTDQLELALKCGPFCGSAGIICTLLDATLGSGSDQPTTLDFTFFECGGVLDYLLEGFGGNFYQSTFSSSPFT